MSAVSGVARMAVVAVSRMAVVPTRVASGFSRRFPRGARTTVALGAGLMVVLMGCADPDEGTNGVGTLSARAIEQKARTAVDRATAVRVTGTLVTQGQTYTLRMRLKKDGGTGSVTTRNTTFSLLRVGDALFLRGSDAFWSQAVAGASPGASPRPGEAGGFGAQDGVADKLDDKYVKVPGDDPAYRQLRGFTDMGMLLDGLIALAGEPVKGERPAVHGMRTVEVKGGDDGAGGTLDVSLEGTPYPVRLVRAGGAGTLTLSDWGRDFALKAPTEDQTVDYGSKIPHT